MTEVMGRPELRTDERFATPPARAKNGAALTAEIERWTGTREKREVMKAFAGRGIVCGAVLDTAEVLADPHLRERGNDFRPRTPDPRPVFGDRLPGAAVGFAGCRQGARR